MSPRRAAASRRGARGGPARRARLLALVALSGAVGSSTGCAILVKQSYWEACENQPPDTSRAGAPQGREAPEAEDEHTHFLGIRTPDAVEQDRIGTRILHVFGGSPAARAGLEPGDELRSINQTTVRSAQDVRRALAATATGNDREVVSIVYGRDGVAREVESRVALVTRSSYTAERRERCFREAAYGGTSFPFFFHHVTRELSPAFLRTYFGAEVSEPVKVYEDLDIFPIALGVSVFRRESVELYDGSRTQLVCWPLRVSTAHDDRTADLHDLIPAPPEGTSDL